MTIYCDIDGTLTNRPDGPWGAPNMENIEALKCAISSGHTVVIWSARGERYAIDFSEKYGIDATYCMGKPDVCFDDIDTIRPPEKMSILPPSEMWSWMTAHGVPWEERWTAK